MRICVNCSSDKTYIGKSAKGKPYEKWYNHKDGYLCKKCYNKLIYGLDIRKTTLKNKR